MITLLIPYFGAFPNYFQVYLDSLGHNHEVLRVVLITDIEVSDYVLPPNLRLVKMSLDDVRGRIHGFLMDTFGRTLPTEKLLPTPYKLVDFKITYPLLFRDLYTASVDDHIGWGDIDVVYGNLSQFVTSEADIIGGWHGHFTAFRNILVYRTLFMKIPNFYELCTDSSRTYITDEIAFRPHLETFIKTSGATVCDLQSNFCDIVPPCFYSLFRSDHKSFSTNFFNVAKPRKNILYLHRESNGSLKTVYDDLEVQETSYVHLQKRAMTVPEDLSTYYIGETEFFTRTEKPVVPRNLFLTWSTKDLPPGMRANVDRLMTQNPTFKVTLSDDTDCRDFLRNHFPPEVAQAFDALKPGAYKADLWRLCVLYVNGGIYMDIKLQNQVPLTSLLDREYFVYDGTFTHNNIKMPSIYNGLIISRPNNPILLKGIVQILLHVSKGYYGETPYDITGPHMLGSLYESREPFLLVHHGPKKAETIRLNDTVLFTEYPEYREDAEGLPYYADLWGSRQVYTESIKLSPTSWPQDMQDIYTKLRPVTRLHLPAIPYTITSDEYSHDAFTGKVKRFSPMMQSLDYEVYHYCIEGSDSGGNQIQLMTKAEWNQLRIDSLVFLDSSLTREAAEAKLNDPKTLVGIIANYTTPLFKEFNRRFHLALQTHYRSRSTDIVCVPLGHSYDEALQDQTVVEFGIGYNNSFANYRIFESYSWLSKVVGQEKKDPNNYWFVIPHAFDTEQLRPVPTPTLQRPRVGLLGRVVAEKGCYVIAEIAKRFPHVDFVLCGQGDPTPFLTGPNLIYQSPIHGSERSAYLSSCAATLCPTTYLEPFGCSAVESQLCGTPVISVDSGGYVETVEHLKTGLRCHTLADFCRGVQMALDGKFDRTYVRDRAVRLYDMYNLAKNYDYVFQNVLDIYRPTKNGWYSPDCHLSRA
jgi:mannosyltransferase OCH1-like enzyme